MTPDEYIQNISYAEKYLALDTETKSKVLFTAEQVLKRHYVNDEIEALDEDSMSALLGEEAIFIAANPWAFKYVFNEYEGLKKFGVHQAVDGEVEYENTLGELANSVKQLASQLGLNQLPDMTGNFTTAYMAY